MSWAERYGESLPEEIAIRWNRRMAREQEIRLEPLIDEKDSIANEFAASADGDIVEGDYEESAADSEAPSTPPTETDEE